MKLTDLEPEFHRYETRPDGEYLPDAATVADAQGIMFVCPACKTHHIQVAFRNRGVLDHQGSHGKDGKPTRWAVSGTGFADLTLQPSVDCGCWHGFVTNGEISTC